MWLAEEFVATKSVHTNKFRLGTCNWECNSWGEFMGFLTKKTLCLQICRGIGRFRNLRATFFRLLFDKMKIEKSTYHKRITCAITKHYVYEFYNTLFKFNKNR